MTLREVTLGVGVTLRVGDDFEWGVTLRVGGNFITLRGGECVKTSH